MKLKTLLNLTALALFAIITSFSAHADTHKMYGIQGDKLSIITKVPSPSNYSVKGQTYTTKTEDDANPIRKKGWQVTIISNLMGVELQVVMFIIQRNLLQHIKHCQ